MVEVSLTVGKVDASLAILTTSDHYVIEFPTVLLPENVEAGSVVKISVEQDLEQEKEQKRKFESVQEQILSKYGSDPPSEPVLHLLNATQTSCVINWDPIHLGSSQLKSLILYKQGNRHLVLTQDAWGKQQENGHGANPWELENDQHNTLKVSGLSVDVEYEFQLLLNTTSGKFWSNVLKVHTHKMTDMSGITVCVGPNTVLDGTATREQIKRSLSKIGANPLQDHVTLETTHFVAVELQDNDEELARARNNNIPIVRPEWVKACELEKRIVGVRDFYLDSAPDTFSQYKFTDESAETEPALETVREESVEQPVEEPVEESVKEPVEEPVEAKEGTVEVPIDAPAEPTTDTTESNDVQESEIPVEEPEKTEQPAEQFDEVPIENTSEPAEQLDEVPIEQPEDVSEATPVEKISEETPADEAPKETPVEEAPKETPIEEAPKETPVEEAPKETPIEEAPKETPVVEAPKETPIEETPNETPVEEAPEETAAEEAPEETPAEKAPEETAAEEAPEETAAEEAPNTNPAEVESGEESEVQVDNTEETSPEAVETENKPSSAPASSSSSKKKNKKKKKGKK
ncbi:chitin biosynthesis protein CHS5 [Kluyveromyces marxianus DMKU3-1042]|uniref:Chitin biosynthesis protein CHS5 n=1 Tax=Kluyveromyces marxianus (strain DMKU3-1042 / BCC 29191 / NBRC 104275) TaxID=1003335 RepID=W0T7A3_KLUMD|nr:chitin biosynthesis protein CHS5 [Kluyveromyces marxianus DMKU3-1042]BAO38923.1 chitin biosynthesis protein CHS5 [Kluyveromyces marxianus DMKU3-1042]